MDKLEFMGYKDFDENLRRARKFKDDHLNRVVEDYINDPIQEKNSSQNAMGNSSSNSNVSFEAKFAKLSVNEQSVLEAMF